MYHAEILSKYPSLNYYNDENIIEIVLADKNITMRKEENKHINKILFMVLCKRLDIFMQNLKIICDIFSIKPTMNLHYQHMDICFDINNNNITCFIKYNFEVIEHIIFEAFDFSINDLTKIIYIIKEKFPELTQRIDDLHIMYFID